MAGEWVTVCGAVMTATYAVDSVGAPTFLSLDRPYPDQLLTLITWEEERWWYATPPEVAFAPPAQVCAGGLVEEYNGVAEIEPTTPITLLADWIPVTSDSFDLDCQGIDDPEFAAICWDILADYHANQDEFYQDALDDLYSGADYYTDDYYRP